VTAKKIGELVFWTEQTECPECGNDVGNVVVLRSVDHEHHVCVKCCVQYEVHTLAPFQWDTMKKLIEGPVQHYSDCIVVEDPREP
jgi:transposase-like protein